VDLDRFQAVSDKGRLLGIASKLGVAIPRQQVVSSPAARHTLAAADLRFPLVLKPSRSVADGGSGRAKLGVAHAADEVELRKRMDYMPKAAFPLLVQERVAGPGVGIFLLVWEGEPIAVFAHRRIREKPPSGGVSVYRESVAAEPGLVARSRELLAQFAWEGLAMIEYKIAAATGTPYLMEINGRFWGSLQLAIDAGVDFPVLLTALAMGERPAPVTTYRAGVRSRWFWGDVDHLLARLRRSPAELALPPGSPGRWRAVRDFLTSWGPADREEILRLDDPLPFVRESRTWFKEL
jgi:predicted ATP-grasp superfamily ATP-dependent carboligase